MLGAGSPGGGFELSREEEALVNRARGLAAEFAPRAREYDEAASFPAENFRRVYEEGLLTLTIPQELGGHGYWLGSRHLPYYLVLEAIASGCASTAWSLKIHSNACGVVAYHGNDEQRRRILGAVVSRGAVLSSIGSEVDPRGGGGIQPVTGSATLRHVRGGFRLSGVKHFGTNSTAAEYHVVHTLVAGDWTIGERQALVALPKDAPGIRLDNTRDALGGRATASWSVHLEDVFIPYENVLGQPGDWVHSDPRTYTTAHVAVLLGIAQGTFDALRDYLQKRQELARNEFLMYTFGDMAAALQATRSSMNYATWLWEQGRHDDGELASLRALHMARETAQKVTTKAFDVCGSRSAFKYLPFDRALRDVRTFTLHTREIDLLRLVVEATLGGEFHSKQKYGRKLRPRSWEALGVPL
jgi:alkylation response protein AidB-like acyl-CoA dehydrogenase